MTVDVIKISYAECPSPTFIGNHDRYTSGTVSPLLSHSSVLVIFLYVFFGTFYLYVFVYFRCFLAIRLYLSLTITTVLKITQITTAAGVYLYDPYINQSLP